jgi:hypothetical protein
MEWLTTPLVDAGLGHAAVMDDGMSERETQLRRLPAPYSLALQLRDAGVDETLICRYLLVEPEALPTLLRLAEAKLAAAHDDARRSPGTAASDE